MNILDTRIDALNLKVEISITAADYQKAENDFLRKQKNRAELKGFRKGMAPMSLIQRLYGEQALVEAVNHVLSDALGKYIDGSKLNFIGEPLQSEDQAEIEWKSGNDFVFKFDLAHTEPLTFNISKDEDKVVYYNITVTDEAKEEMKKNMLRQFGDLQEGEAAGEEDFLVVDFENEGKTVNDVYVAVRSVAGESKSKFLGAKAGDKFEINVNEAFENESDRAAMLKVKKEELADLNPVFNVTVLNVKTFVDAQENQETYDKMCGAGKVHNSEEFDGFVAARLAENYRQEADYRFSKDVKDYFLKKADISLPEAFLKRWLLHINEGKFTPEQIDAEFGQFLVDYRWQMIRDYVMGKYELKTTQKDMEDAAKGFVAYQYAMYGLGNVPDEMLTEAAQNVLKDERQSRQIYESVEDQKVISALKENVSLNTEEISVEKFRELK